MHKCNRLLRLIMAIIILPLTGCSGGGTSRIEYLQFSPGGKWLVAAGGVWLRSGEIKVWECSSWKLYADWTNSLSDQIQNGRFASDEEFVSIGGKMDTKDKRKYGGNEIRFWNISDKREIRMFDLRNARGFAKQIDYLAAKEMVVFGQLSKGGAGQPCVVCLHCIMRLSLLKTWGLPHTLGFRLMAPRSFVVIGGRFLCLMLQVVNLSLKGGLTMPKMNQTGRASDLRLSHQKEI